MSLTSYRLLHPAINHCAPSFQRPMPKRTEANALARRSIPSGGFLRRQPGQSPGCEAYVPMRARFGKGHRPTFEDFATVKTGIIGSNGPARALLPELAQKPSLIAKTSPLRKRHGPTPE